jgi:methylated-DNA-[protein]-cysteine S-methyltransferase
MTVGGVSAPRLAYVQYDAPGWGIGEVVFRGDMPIHHDEPSAQRSPSASAAPPSPFQRRLVERLVAYFAGERVAFADVDLAPTLAFAGATAFEAACVHELQRVPYGATISYAELAARAGRPRAARGAGRACARGTLSVVVPYHRVIRADGSIGEYGPDGIGLKRRLLAHEGVELP